MIYLDVWVKRGVKDESQLFVLEDWVGVDNIVYQNVEYTPFLTKQNYLHILYFPRLYSLAFQDEFIWGHVAFEGPGKCSHGDVWDTFGELPGDLYGLKSNVAHHVQL